MPLTRSPTPAAFAVVQGLRNAVSNDTGQGRIALEHRVHMARPRSLPAMSYTGEISREPNGGYIATCREMPGLLVGAGTEAGALTLAKVIPVRVRSQQLASGSTTIP